METNINLSASFNFQTFAVNVPVGFTAEFGEELPLNVKNALVSIEMLNQRTLLVLQHVAIGNVPGNKFDTEYESIKLASKTFNTMLKDALEGSDLKNTEDIAKYGVAQIKSIVDMLKVMKEMIEETK